MARWRFGVIGTGYMGRLEARVLQQQPDCALIGVWNRTPERAALLAQELGCRHYKSLEALLADEAINAVVVATANYAHREPVLAAAQAGKHIFLEKPMALTVADCRAMIKAVQQADVVLFLGHPQRFMDGVRAARQALLDGTIGRPVAMRCERIFWADPRGSSPHWKMKRQLSGGHLFHHMHELCTARWLLGEYESVYAQMANLAHSEDGPEAEDDVVQLAVRFETGVLATFEFGSAYRQPEHCMTIYGTKGTIVIHWQESRVLIRGLWGEETRPMYDDPLAQHSAEQTYAALKEGRVHGRPDEEAPYFLRLLVEREFAAMTAYLSGTFNDLDNEDLFGGEAGLRAVELAEAALLSNERRAMITLPLP